MQGFASTVRSRKWVKRMLGLDHAIEEKRWPGAGGGGGGG